MNKSLSQLLFPTCSGFYSLWSVWQGSSGPDDLFEDDCYSPSSLSSSSSSSVPLGASHLNKILCTSCGQEIVDRYLLKVQLTLLVLNSSKLCQLHNQKFFRVSKCIYLFIKMGFFFPLGKKIATGWWNILDKRF